MILGLIRYVQENIDLKNISQPGIPGWLFWNSYGSVTEMIDKISSNVYSGG